MRIKKLLRNTLIIFIAIMLVYAFGPSPATPAYDNTMPSVTLTAKALEKFIVENEAQHKLKQDNQARVIWSDSSKQKTPYSIVYLHGFSASQAEGEPVHRNIAKKFRCNLYLSRLAEHGLDTIDPMINLTADEYWESAKRSLAIGKQLGNKVILMGTSTGGTNALQLAAAYPSDVAALILLSPNIAINNDKAYLLNNPWGLQIAKLVSGSDYVVAKDQRDIYKQYWYPKYPLQAAVALQEMLETSMNKETFKKVKQPTLMLYYYKDRVHQDSVVSVSAMLRMFQELGTPKDAKHKQAMPEAGDHVIGSYIKSKDVEGVEKEIQKFFLHTLNMK